MLLSEVVKKLSEMLEKSGDNEVEVVDLPPAKGKDAWVVDLRYA